MNLPRKSFTLALGILTLATILPAWAEGNSRFKTPTLVADAPAAPATKGAFGAWDDQGPGPIDFAQVENIVPNNQAVGAINAVAPHPTDPNVLYVGAINGGVWKTENATALQPSWEQLTDKEDSLSISELQFDPTDGTLSTLWAGIGLNSSFARIGSQRLGLMRTTNGGNSWQLVNGGGALFNKDISGVAPRGNAITVSVNFANPFTFGNIGMFRSTDGGASFSMLSGDGVSGLPLGAATDLVSDPNNPSTLYTVIVFAGLLAQPNGVYKSTDAGATWTKVSDAAIDALLGTIFNTGGKPELAVGQHDNVYVGITVSGRLQGLFRSGNGGGSWAQLDTPGTIEQGFFIGIHPGGQASIHMSIAADPGNANLVYVGGDRQPFASEASGGSGFFPNSIGAFNFSGRLFRVDASQPLGSQSTHLTHNSALGAPGGGTASNSSPHADSRDMAFDVAGNLIESDDGGVYKRTSPSSNTGDWFSLNGDIQTNEQHSIAYDSNSDTLISGNQDNGTTYQTQPDSTTWELLLSGDGGDTAVDDRAPGGVSTRFSSAQFLGNFNRTFWNAANNFVGFDFPALQVVGGGAPIQAQFTTPIALNAEDPDRLIVGGNNSIYESLDQGATVTEIGPGLQVVGTGRNPIAAGAGGDAELLYVGSIDRIYFRDATTPLTLRASFPGTGTGATIRGIGVDPADGDHAFVANTVGLFRTQDGGVTWTDVSGDIFDVAVTPFRSMVYIPRADGEDIVIVGANNGAFLAREEQGFVKWKSLGNKLPTVPVYELDYDAADNVLIAGTLGRGAWKLILDDDDD